jgi:hypothetical protein
VNVVMVIDFGYNLRNGGTTADTEQFSIIEAV